MFSGVLWLFMGNWWWGGAESLVKGQLKLHILLIDSAKNPELDGIISPSGFYGSSINHRKWRGEVSSRFPLVSTGVCKLPLKPTASEWCNLVLVECLWMIKATAVAFGWTRGWCYSGWWVWDLRTVRQL